MSKQEEATEVVHETAKRCKRELIKKKHELGLDGSWKFETMISFSCLRSNGNGERISMHLGWYVGRKTSCYGEYHRIHKDNCIGSVRSPDWRHAIMTVTAHEMAHCAQHALRYKPLGKRGIAKRWDLKTPHGDGWRRIYGILRREIINPLVLEAGGEIGTVKHWRDIEREEAQNGPDDLTDLSWRAA